MGGSAGATSSTDCRLSGEYHVERVQQLRRAKQLHPSAPLARGADAHSIPEDEHICDPIEGRAACHLAPAEWRLLGWLEREHFSYDFYSETQFHFGQLCLDDYRVVIISVHPEYWSAAMYEALKAWVFERGGRLMYLAGNGVNCEVEFVDNHTCIYRNEDARQLRDPELRLESRFHQRRESEANLLGVVYDERGIMTAAPYEVVDDSHWIFAKASTVRSVAAKKTSPLLGELKLKTLAVVPATIR